MFLTTPGHHIWFSLAFLEDFRGSDTISIPVSQSLLQPLAQHKQLTTATQMAAAEFNVGYSGVQIAPQAFKRHSIKQRRAAWIALVKLQISEWESGSGWDTFSSNSANEASSALTFTSSSFTRSLWECPKDVFAFLSGWDALWIGRVK